QGGGQLVASIPARIGVVFDVPRVDGRAMRAGRARCDGRWVGDLGYGIGAAGHVIGEIVVVGDQPVIVGPGIDRSSAHIVRAERRELAIDDRTVPRVAQLRHIDDEAGPAGPTYRAGAPEPRPA